MINLPGSASPSGLRRSGETEIRPSEQFLEVGPAFDAGGFAGGPGPVPEFLAYVLDTLGVTRCPGQ